MKKRIVFGHLVLSLLFVCNLSWSADKALKRSPVDRMVNRDDERVPSRGERIDIVPGVMIVKFRQGVTPRITQSETGHSLTAISTLDTKMERFGPFTIRQLFPHKKFQKTGGAGDLSNIYEFRLSDKTDIHEIVETCQSDPSVIYAEPRYFRYLDITVNDPRYPDQRHLEQIQADSAWDFSQGDSSVIIAIIDTGVDWDHEDLDGDIFVNPGEDVNGNKLADAGDINGVDDDGNGLVDDIRGWDFVDVPLTWPEDLQPAIGEDGCIPDNDPSDFDGHGTHCAGIASARTNNNIGVAGIGFDCTIMAVRVGYLTQDGRGTLPWGFEGIVYAADMGVDIISLSWGGGGYSQYEQDLINYAYNKGIFIVAAAGNEDSEASHYPGSYENVFSVAYTLHDIDIKANDSNYGETVDICAPGTQILSTLPNDYYGRLSGSSMACPLVAGTAGLVLSLNPGWDNERIGIQLKETADPVDDRNPDYRGLLGSGRVNAYRALAESPSSIQVIDYHADDSSLGNDDGIVDIGESVDLTITLKSYLDDVTSVQATLSTDDSYITILQGTVDFGTILKGDSVSNEAAPFSFVSDPSTPLGHRTSLRLDITGNSSNYSTFKYINIYIQPLFSDHSINNVTFTISSFGLYGYNDYAETNRYMGNGFQYPSGNANALYLGSFWVGKSGDQVSDCSYGNDTYDNYDWITSDKGMLKIKSNGIANQTGRAVFNDSRSNNPIGIRITQKSYAWTSTMDEDYVVLEYTIQNRSGEPQDDLYAGLYMDWDIAVTNENQNHVGYDSDKNLGYMWAQSSNYYGISMLYPEPTAYQAIDHDLYVYNNQLNDLNKYGFMSGGFQVLSSDHPYDWSHVLSTGPFSLDVNEKKVVTFAVLGGDDESDIKNNAASALQKYFLMAPADIVIDHTPLKDTENTSDSISVEATLFSQSGSIDSDSVLIYWRKENETTFQTIPMSHLGNDHYIGQIAPQTQGQIVYYLCAKDIQGRSARLPFEAPDTLFSFDIGPDTIKPVISEVTNLGNTLNRTGPFTVDGRISDNQGVESSTIYLHFNINDNNPDSVLMKQVENSVFSADLIFDPPLAFGDSISYLITAKDVAQKRNRRESSIFNFIIVNTLLIDDFETDLNHWDLGLGWDANFFAYGGANSITDSPAGFYIPNIENRLTLLTPFDLSDQKQASLTYFYIHVLSTGDSFHVEASGDGQIWKTLTTYAGESGYMWQEDTLTMNEFCGTGGDSVQIRFRLKSNEDNEVADGIYLDDIYVLVDTVQTTVEKTNKNFPKSYRLIQNYPNPFNPETVIGFEIPKSGHVTLEIYDLLGRHLLSLVNEVKEPGRYRVKWNGLDQNKMIVPAGIYFYRLKAASFVDVKKMILLK